MQEVNTQNQQKNFEKQKTEQDFDMPRLIKQDFQKQFNESIQEQNMYFQKILSQDYLFECQKYSQEKLQQKTNKFQNISVKSLKLEGIDMSDFNFARFISSLDKVFLFFNKKTDIYIIDIKEQKNSNINYDKDKVTSLEYDSVSEVFVFGHQSGKVSFAMYKGNQFIQCFSDILNVTSQPIVNINLIYGTDAICIITDQNVSELLIKFKNNNTYQIFHLLKMSSRNFYQINSFCFFIKEYNRIKVFLTLISNNLVFLINFEIIFDTGELKELLNLKILKKFQIENENDKYRVNVVFNEIEIGNKIDLFISSGICLEQYYITKDSQVNLIRKFQSKNIILYLLQPQNNYLQILFDDYTLSEFTDRELDSVNKNSDDFENHLTKIQKLDDLTNKQKINVNFEIENNGFSFINFGQLYVLEFLSWEKFFNQKLQSKNYIEAFQQYLQFLNGYNNNLLNVYNQEISDDYTQREQIKAQKYQLNQKLYVSQLLEESKTIFKQKKYFGQFIGLCLQLIFKTSNFNFMNTEYLDILFNPLTFSHDNLKEVLIHITTNLDTQNIHQFSEIFFVKLFQLGSKNKDCLDEIEKFLLYISINYPLNKNLILTLKELSKIYNLRYYNMLFYLTNPQNLEYFDTLLQRRDIDQILCIFYDFWQEQNYIQIIQQITKSKQQLQEFQVLLKMWMLMKYKNLLEIDEKKTSWISILMNEEHFSYIHQQNIILTNIDVKFAQIFQQIFQEKTKDKILITLFIYKQVFTQSRFCQKQIGLYFIRILNPQFLQYVQNEFDYDYFCQLLLKIYVEQKFDLNQDDEFKKFITANQNQNKITELIYNEVFEKIEDNFDYYLQKNWYYDILNSYFKCNENQSQHKYLQVFKSRCLEIINKDESKFQKLFQYLQISDKMQVIEQIKDPLIKKKLFMQISEKEQQFLIGGGILQVLKFKCLFQPSEVIDYLNSNYYQINEAIKVCEETKNKRGKCYLTYKQGLYQEAEILYKDYIKELWLEGSKESEQIIITLIDDILGLKHDQIDQINFYLKILAYVSRFNGKFEIKRTITKMLYSKIFSMNFNELLKKIKNLKLYEMFQQKRLLSQYLLKNFQTIIDFNELKDRILAQQNQIITKNYLKQSFQGIQLNIQPCMTCKQIDNSQDLQEFFQFHGICQKMVHSKCHEQRNKEVQQNLISSCKYCSQQDNLFLTQQNQKKSVAQKDLDRKSKLLKKRTMIMNPQKLFQKNIIEIDQVFFQEDKFQKEEFVKQNKQKVKRGLANVEYSKFYFDVFQLINNINGQRNSDQQQLVSLQFSP